MHGPLAFYLNDDGTVTLRCDADAFFAHADEIRRLLTGSASDESESGAADASAAVGRRRRKRPAAGRAPAPAAGTPADAAMASSPIGPNGSNLAFDEAPRGASGGSAGSGAAQSRGAGRGAGQGAGQGAGAASADRSALAAFWSRLFSTSDERQPNSRDLSAHGVEILAAGYYLTRERGFEAFSREDLQEVFAALPSEAGPTRPVKTGTLVHLARREWLERVRRGAYRLSRRAIDRVESLRRLDTLPPPPASAPVPALPSLVGLSRFLREVPTNRKWRRVLLVAYFLHEHGEIEEFDRRVLGAVFQRLRGIDTPGSLAALISQVLHKRRGVLERGSRRGMYRLTAAALDDLRRNPRVAQADAVHRSEVVRTVTKSAS